MAKLPVEIVRIGNTFHKTIEEVIELLNNTQKEIQFSLLSPNEEEKFQLLDYKDADCDHLVKEIDNARHDLKGFHPYLIAITNSHLKNDMRTNLFGNAYPQEGLAVFTFSNIPDIIIPSTKIKAYVAYYLARYTFSFLNPFHENHDDTRGCVYDFKQDKRDILKSMKAGALCDQCRALVNSPISSMSASQFASLNTIFAKTEELLIADTTLVETKAAKPKIFIGSSTEGLSVAREIKNNLKNDYQIDIWDEGTFDRLGLSFLEILDAASSKADYGIFIFTPDDQIRIRGEKKNIARDNVIFELGLFVGKLSRKKAFLVYPKKADLHILSDFAGITAATYDSTESDLKKALESVCTKIRTSIN